MWEAGGRRTLAVISVSDFFFLNNNNKNVSSSRHKCYKTSSFEIILYAWSNILIAVTQTFKSVGCSFI